METRCGQSLEKDLWLLVDTFLNIIYRDSQVHVQVKALYCVHIRSTKILFIEPKVTCQIK